MDNFLVFRNIVKYLNLNDILNIRQINANFMYLVDDYLNNIEALTIFCRKYTPVWTEEYCMLRFNYRFRKSLVYDAQTKDTYGCEENFLTALMPNIKQFSIFYLPDLNSKLLELKLLLPKWRQITKIMVTIPYREDEIHEMLKNFNVLESLETFVIYNEVYLLNDLRLREEPFLSRIKHMFVPKIEWLDDVSNILNLESLGISRYSTNLNKVLFENLQTFLILDCFPGSLDKRSEFVIFLYNLHAVCKDNLRSFKIFRSVYFTVSFYVEIFNFYNLFFLYIFYRKKISKTYFTSYNSSTILKNYVCI